MKSINTTETQYKMPLNAKFDASPNSIDSLINTVLTYAIDRDGNKVPEKIFKITNNAEFTVYPVLRDGNEAETEANSGVGQYDPYDPVKTEYRGYVGYQGDDKAYYFGLQPGQTIAIRIPLVFWNGARMGIVTEGQFLAPEAGTPNPLHFNAGSTCVIVASEKTEPDSIPKSIPNGVVMWYRATLEAPALDSPDQLIEWTIRDRAYMSSDAITKATHGKIPENERTTLINYDVSYVDNMLLPVAMEALDVPVPAPPVPFDQNRGPYGWIGSVISTGELQKQIKDFTADNNQLLGSYFGGKGWPFYITNVQDLIKIPAGQNVFAQSPLANALSSYFLSNNNFMLSSGGTEPIQVASIGGNGQASSGDTITLTPNLPAEVKKLKPGMSVEGAAPKPGMKSPIQPGAKVKEIQIVDNQDPKVILDKDLVGSEEGWTFNFFRPVTDYASETMIKLWYSWAKIYLDQTQNTQPQTLTGNVEKDKATLRFNSQTQGLVVGMQVSGPGLDKRDSSPDTGGIVILEIAEDKRSITLSQLAKDTLSGGSYQFDKPQPLPVTPQDLHTFDFSKDPQEEARVPAEFAKKVYLVMAAMAQVPKEPGATPHVLQLMNNVVGGTMGFIFDTPERKLSPDGLKVSAMVRDMIKSLLRGVTDFTIFPEKVNGNWVWYPDPKMPRGGLPFNAFNLDPFVRFIHVTLGFSGYGFSLDDDTADVSATGATRLHITIAGVGGLINVNEWTIQAVYGPVPGTGHWDPNATKIAPLGISNASNTTPITITCVKHGLKNGEKAIMADVRGNTNANGPFTVANAQTDTFELANSIGNGNYEGGGNWYRDKFYYISGVNSLDVYWKLKGDDRDSGFQGALVDGPGVTKEGDVRVQQLGDYKEGILGLNKQLTQADGSPLPEGDYSWTFGKINKAE